MNCIPQWLPHTLCSQADNYITLEYASLVHVLHTHSDTLVLSQQTYLLRKGVVGGGGEILYCMYLITSCHLVVYGLFSLQTLLKTTNHIMVHDVSCSLVHLRTLVKRGVSPNSSLCVICSRTADTLADGSKDDVVIFR